MKTCIECGKLFSPKRKSTIYCSRLCLKERQKWKYRNQEREKNMAREIAKRKSAKRDAAKRAIGCALCGYNKCGAALAYHHPNKDKELNVSHHWNTKKAQDEARKCVLLCTNCHMEVHYDG